MPYVEGVCEIDDKKLSMSYASNCDACGKEERSRGMALLEVRTLSEGEVLLCTMPAFKMEGS